MTLKEAKDQVARTYGWRNWEEIDFYQLSEMLSQVDAPYHESDFYDEAAELYACEARENETRELREQYVLVPKADMDELIESAKKYNITIKTSEWP